MAADAPFGLSFGDPRRYMGQSPLAEIGKAAKTGLMAYAVQQSGLEKYLNEQGISKNKQGNYGYNAPAGAVPPVTTANTGMAPVAPSTTGSPVMPSGAVAPNAVAPATPAPAPLTPPPNIGGDILDGKFEGVQTSFVDPQAQRDSLVLPQQAGYNQMLQTGNEYQQVPGYGKLAKAFQAFAGGMG
jgi:hypothetical protein